MSVQYARDVYNIAQWSDSYFDISEEGTLLAFPDGDKERPGINLLELTKDIIEAGLGFPVLVRFIDILKQRFDHLRNAFARAIQDHNYQGQYISVYPIKVNQQRRVVEEILKHGGNRVGLEAGSKPELMAVLALSAGPDSLIICNGYKDREYIRLALIGQCLGHHVYIILEKMGELDIVLEEARNLGVQPQLGLRVRLASVGAGKWQDTGGEKSKFGFSATQVLEVIDRLHIENNTDRLQLLHFHLGSQIANITDIQRGMRECARYYAELRALGCDIKVVDVGGGLAVDYDGTHSRTFCSMNYSIQEYANNIVYTIAEICNENQLPHPQIITESGRAMTAHHAMLITNVIGVEKTMNFTPPEAPHKDELQVIQELWHGYTNLSERSALEAYHDACYWMSELNTMYTHGVVNLKERARAEQIYLSTCAKVYGLLKHSVRSHREILDELNEKLANKYFCNFSLFQSLPDAWAIDQIFPILPLTGLDQDLNCRGVLQDITCDSDGRIHLYVDNQGVDKTLPLLPYTPGKPYLLGIFLVGAYQEILGDMHNLFGDTDSVHVELKPEGGYRLVQPLQGNTVEEVLRYVQFDAKDLLQSYRQQLAKSALSSAQTQICLQELMAGLHGYTYLEDY